MSPARTGSVGAMIAPSTTAAPSDSPITPVPNSATAAIVNGIATSSSRATLDHERRAKGSSSFSPVPNSAITIASSARCSIRDSSESGSTQPMPASWITTAAAVPSPR